MNAIAVTVDSLKQSFLLLRSGYLKFLPGALLCFLFLSSGDSGLIFLPFATATLIYAAILVLSPGQRMSHRFMTLYLAGHFILHLFAFFLFFVMLLLVTAIVSSLSVDDEVGAVSLIALLLVTVLSFRFWPLLVSCYISGVKQWKSELIFRWMVGANHRPTPLRTIWRWTRHATISFAGWFPFVCVLMIFIFGYQVLADSDSDWLGLLFTGCLSIILLPWLYLHLVYIAWVNLIDTGHSPRFFFANTPDTFDDITSPFREKFNFAHDGLLEERLEDRLDFIVHLTLPRDELDAALSDFKKMLGDNGYIQTENQGTWVCLYPDVASYRNYNAPVAIAAIDDFTVSLAIVWEKGLLIRGDLAEGLQRWLQQYPVHVHQPVEVGLVADLRARLRMLNAEFRQD